MPSPQEGQYTAQKLPARRSRVIATAGQAELAAPRDRMRSGPARLRGPDHGGQP
jgi:hypothetical protein